MTLTPIEAVVMDTGFIIYNKQWKGYLIWCEMQPEWTASFDDAFIEDDIFQHAIDINTLRDCGYFGEYEISVVDKATRRIITYYDVVIV